MTRSELHLPDTAFIGPGLLFLNQYFNSFIDEHIVLWIAMVSTEQTSKAATPTYFKRIRPQYSLFQLKIVKQFSAT